MSYKNFIIMALIFLGTPFAQAADFYVTGNGSGSTCSTGSPCALSYGNSNANNGDTIYLMDTGGNFGTLIAPTDSGVTYQNYTGDSPALVNVSGISVDMNGQSNITLDGITFTNPTGSGNIVWVDINGEDNITIQNCTFTASVSTGANWSGISVQGTSDGLYILDNTFSITHADGPDDAINIRGDVGNAPSHVLVKGNTVFGNGGHACIDIHSDEGVVEYFAVIDNTFDANGSNSACDIYYRNDYGLLENNICKNSAAGANNFQISSDNLIMRYNTGLDGARGLQFNSDRSYDTAIYNNVFHNNSQASTLVNATYVLDGFVYINNANEDGDFDWLLNPDGINLRFEYNNFNGGTETYEGTSTLSNIESGYAYWQNNLEVSPGFTNEGGDDFTLTEGSNLRDAGGPLTYTNDGGGGSGTSLVVDEAFVFQANWGITGFSHDWICVGSTSVGDCSEIASINYGTNTITLESSLTWDDNDPVYLYKNSQDNVVLYGSAPDIGAYEYSGEVPLPVMTGIRIGK